MTHKTWLIVATVLYGFFGFGLLLVPAAFMATYGVALDGGGQMMARILGSALVSLAIAFWLYRDRPLAAVLPLLQISVAYNVVDFFVVLAATLAGTMNTMGWGPVGLHVFLAAGFAWFAFRRDAE